ncbi:Holliday junction resolvase RuvX [Phocicoccus pinnipedialis]|uniref:Putative pre-16S rRNA nuclease n=1 Tax=Phocicoccus pinnipedialis TaxID=110845 RepID=A0A6V7RF65_9BACL|nr:Holliday junction resolvase RuvX [Jeotgalicoccus pinnipedialis]MBP1939228.1 putative Holliday junction resolvase [Jeotgalicoccus pinnipedialis]CAD2076222.1 Putative Holliday junction resolvase [Jeotgalicoccus pinnipedialis]
MDRTLGLDLGTKTIGVAVSDMLGWTAQGITTLKIDTLNDDYGIDAIGELIKEYQVKTIVVGLPKNMNNTIGESGERTMYFSNLLENNFSGVKIVLWDERLSTVAAERALLEADVSRKKRSKVIDKMAAVFILQGYLDSH